jgi:AcrR family transcriptional regulator
VTVRLEPAERRERIVDAALSVMLRKGLAATTARDVAAEMRSSPGLLHHYFGSMDELLATAFERAALQGFAETEAVVARTDVPVERLRAFFTTYTRAEQDWAFQLWLDAWAEAARRPALQEVSQRLNVAWQRLLRDIIGAGVATADFRCDDPEGAAWRILSLLDGLALQTVAHRGSVTHEAVLAWSLRQAELELALPTASLGA